MRGFRTPGDKRPLVLLLGWQVGVGSCWISWPGRAGSKPMAAPACSYSHHVLPRLPPAGWAASTST